MNLYRAIRCCPVPLLLTLLAWAGAATAPLGAVEPSMQGSTYALRFPELVTVRIDAARLSLSSGALAVRTVPEGRPLWFGSNVVIQVAEEGQVEQCLAGSPLRMQGALVPGLYVLNAPDATTALHEADRLAALPGMRLSRPGLIRPALRPHGPNAPYPNDPRFASQWYLENRRSDGSLAGPDLNTRQAWYWTRGAGVVVAVVDDGVELAHPEFASAASNAWHYNFIDGNTQAGPASGADIQSTAVAGFAVARGGNQRGIVGTAPAAGLASWKIFNGDTLPLSDDQLATMFRYRTESVSVQNHSWGNSSYEPLGPSLPEQLAISNAVVQGRGGRGVVMVRSGGNGRGDLINVNEDGYANDPRVMAVASIGIDGRASSFSSPGACLWVAAPGGGSPAVVTTDRLGTAGFNSLVTGGDDADYVVSTSLQGTSFSAPQVSGLAALLLAVNPGLGWRDVREIVALSARQFDLADPGLATNAAGLAHSHNTGFGVPDAGKAVELARRWVNRPTPVEVRFPVAVVQAIPDDGLRVMVTGSGVPPALASIPATPGLGPHADDPTPSLPLVDVDVATNDLTVDLTGKAALIQRGPPGDFSDKRNTFRRKVERAAAAGATFAILWNHTNGTERIIPGDLDFTPIPAVFIDENTGRALRSQLSLDPNLQARLQLTSTELQFTVAQSLRVESVQVRIQSNHSRRGDVRVTLRSPSGTRSVLQQVNFDDLPGPGAAGWTYTSARHLGEPGAGAWSLTVSDEQAGNAGALTGAELILSGQGIVDHDRDGLDDGWETSFFGGLAAGPLEDPDGDGRVTGREQLEGTHPGVSDLRHEVWFSVWNHELGRLSWPGGDGRAYDVLSATNAGGPLEFQAVVPGRFPETEWFVPLEAVPGRFFRVRF